MVTRQNPTSLPSHVRVKQAAEKVLRAVRMLTPRERKRALEVVRLLSDDAFTDTVDAPPTET